MQNEAEQAEDLTPTPTQAENDRAKLGGQPSATAEEVAKVEDSGTKPSPGAKANREVKAAAGVQYETR